ncbi:MAG: transposase [Planctomycetaceae bacterium]|jgi:putative transposase|nr:transposase [Planctomycetaceae bacterium]
MPPKIYSPPEGSVRRYFHYFKRTKQFENITGIKRHFLVDVLGLLICIVVHTANIQERDGAKLVLEKMSKQNLPRLKKVLADGGYSGDKMKAEAAKYGNVLKKLSCWIF